MLRSGLATLRTPLRTTRKKASVKQVRVSFVLAFFVLPLAPMTYRPSSESVSSSWSISSTPTKSSAWNVPLDLLASSAWQQSRMISVVGGW